MYLVINHKPVAKARPRFSIYNGRARAYNCQSAINRVLKAALKSQMRRKGYLKLDGGAIHVSLINYVPIPNSWSQKRSKEAQGEFVISRPDVDNYLKQYLDLMNGIVYDDDNRVVSVLSQKIYSVKPRTEINITKIGEQMITEHAKTVVKIDSMEDLDYMIKKANRLGMSGRQIVRVSSQEDAEGLHVYFDVEGLKHQQTVSRI